MSTIKELLAGIEAMTIENLKARREELTEEIKDIDKLLFLKGERKRMPRKAKEPAGE
jgi:hypothetical protein